MTPRPLASFLARLIWLCMTPLVLLALWLAWDSLEKQEARHRREGANLAKNVATSLDQHLRARSNALHMLAVSPLADDPARWPELYLEAQGVRESFGIHVIFADSDRQMLFNTRMPYGAQLPRLPDSKGQTAAPLALETGRPQVGDIVFGPVAKVPLVAIAVPVLRDGLDTRLLLSIFETGQLQQRLDRIALPDGWSLALQDSTGADIARRSPPDFDSARDVADDHRFVVRSELSPWSVLLEIPRATHWQTNFRTAAFLAAGIVLATLLGALGGTLASRRLGREMALLTAAPGQEPAPLEIAEIAAARRLIDESLASRLAGERALREIQAQKLEEQREVRLAALNRMEDANVARAEAEAGAAALRESQERLQVLIDHAPAALAMFDREMRYLAVSRRWRDDYQLGAGELLGRSHYEIFPDLPERIVEVHRRGLAGEIIAADEDHFEREDGSAYWLRWEMRPWRAADGGVGGIVIFSEDITRLTEARHEILALNAGLEQRVAERTAELSAANRELDSFAYAVSHDLRAPLRAMSGFARALEEDCGDQLHGEAQVYLEQIDIAGRRMNDLIDGILALSRITRGELQRGPVDLSALAVRLLAELARQEPERRVVWQVAPGLGVRGDARMLEAALGNLLGNAWKYSGKAAAAEIRVHAEERDGRRWICVADNGAGFDPAHAARLFQPFQRLHRQEEFPGIGIGLATVARIIHRHGGAIEARGEPGQGASFCFTLPAGAEDQT